MAPGSGPSRVFSGFVLQKFTAGPGPSRVFTRFVVRKRDPGPAVQEDPLGPL